LQNEVITITITTGMEIGSSITKRYQTIHFLQLFVSFLLCLGKF